MSQDELKPLITIHLMNEGAAAGDALAKFCDDEKLTDIVIHTHGFNNDENAATGLGSDYLRHFDEMAKKRSDRKVGYCLTFWPSSGAFYEFGTVADRAVTVGRGQLAPAINKLLEKKEGVRVHLSGHSLGARLSGAALLGLNKKIESLFLIQGALPAFWLSGNVVELSLLKGITTQFLGAKDTTGLLAQARTEWVNRVGTTYSTGDGMMLAYIAGGLINEGFTSGSDLVKHLGITLPSAGTDSLASPKADTAVNVVPMGLKGALEGWAVNAGAHVKAGDVGCSYPPGSALISFDFSDKIRDHNAFRLPEVAWAHLCAAGMA